MGSYYEVGQFLSPTQVNTKKKRKVEFLLLPETNIDWGGQNLTPGMWLESATL